MIVIDSNAETSSTVSRPPRRGLNRQEASLDAPKVTPILTNRSSTSHRRGDELRKALRRKLSTLEGPRVTIAEDNDERLLELFVKDFEFINSYKLHEGVTGVEDSFNSGCDCGKVCDPKRCSCLTQAEDSDDLMIPYERAEARPDLMVLRQEFLTGRQSFMIYECTPLCGCTDKCWNRVVQHGRTMPLEIFHTGNRGFG